MRWWTWPIAPVARADPSREPAAEQRCPPGERHDGHHAGAEQEGPEHDADDAGAATGRAGEVAGALAGHVIGGREVEREIGWEGGLGQGNITLGLRDQLRWASEASNKRYVRRDGRLLPLPMSPGAFFSTPLFSFGAKLALMGEPFRPPGDPNVEEPIAAFVRRRRTR